MRVARGGGLMELERQAVSLGEGSQGASAARGGRDPRLSLVRLHYWEWTLYAPAVLALAARGAGPGAAVHL